MSQKGYTMRINLDTKQAIQAVDALAGSIKDISGNRVIVDFQYNENIGDLHEKLQQAYKEHPELDVQFRYDISKSMLKQAQKELSNMEIVLDDNKSNEKLSQLYRRAIELKRGLDDASPNTKEWSVYKGELSEVADEILTIEKTLEKTRNSTALSDSLKNSLGVFEQINSIIKEFSLGDSISPLDTKKIVEQKALIEELQSEIDKLRNTAHVADILVNDQEVQEKVDKVIKQLDEIPKEKVINLKLDFDDSEDELDNGINGSIKRVTKQAGELLGVIKEIVDEIKDNGITINTEKIENQLKTVTRYYDSVLNDGAIRDWYSSIENFDYVDFDNLPSFINIDKNSGDLSEEAQLLIRVAKAYGVAEDAIDAFVKSYDSIFDKYSGKYSFINTIGEAAKNFVQKTPIDDLRVSLEGISGVIEKIGEEIKGLNFGDITSKIDSVIRSIGQLGDVFRNMQDETTLRSQTYVNKYLSKYEDLFAQAVQDIGGGSEKKMLMALSSANTENGDSALYDSYVQKYSLGAFSSMPSDISKLKRYLEFVEIIKNYIAQADLIVKETSSQLSERTEERKAISDGTYESVRRDISDNMGRKVSAAYDEVDSLLEEVTTDAVESVVGKIGSADGLQSRQGNVGTYKKSDIGINNTSYSYSIKTAHIQELDKISEKSEISDRASERIKQLRSQEEFELIYLEDEHNRILSQIQEEREKIESEYQTTKSEMETRLAQYMKNPRQHGDKSYIAGGVKRQGTGLITQTKTQLAQLEERYASQLEELQEQQRIEEENAKYAQKQLEVKQRIHTEISEAQRQIADATRTIAAIKEEVDTALEKEVSELEQRNKEGKSITQSKIASLVKEVNSKNEVSELESALIKIQAPDDEFIQALNGTKTTFESTTESVTEDINKTSESFEELKGIIENLSSSIDELSQNIKNIASFDSIANELTGGIQRINIAFSEIDYVFNSVNKRIKDLKKDFKGFYDYIQQMQDEKDLIGAIVPSEGDINNELSPLTKLKEELKEINKLINEKTEAFKEEATVVEEIVPQEVDTLHKITEEVMLITNNVQELCKALRGIDDSNGEFLSLSSSLENIASSISETNLKELFGSITLNNQDTENSVRLLNALFMQVDALSNRLPSLEQLSRLMGSLNATLDPSSIKEVDLTNIESSISSINTNVSSLLDNISKYNITEIVDAITKSVTSLAEAIKNAENVVINMTDNTSEKIDDSDSKIEKTRERIKEQIESYRSLVKSIQTIYGELALDNSMYTDMVSILDKIDNGKSIDDYTGKELKQLKDVLKAYKETGDGLSELITDFEKSKNSIGDSIKKDIDYLDEIIKNVNTKYITSETTKNGATTVLNIANELKTAFSNFPKDITSIGDVAKFNELTDKLKNLKLEVKDLEQKSGNLTKLRSIINDIIGDLGKWTGMTRKQKEAYEELLKRANELYDSGKGSFSSAELADINNKFLEIRGNVKESHKDVKSFFDMIFTRVRDVNAKFFAQYFSFQDIVRYAREMFSIINELDYALVDLRKTAKMNTEELNNFYKSSSDVAKNLGVTSKEIIEQASSWSRLGYSTAEAATQMAELSSQFALISPGMNVETATTGLVSVMKAFRVEVEDVKDGIMSPINAIGNAFATNNQEIIAGLERSSAAMYAANNTLEQTIALFTAGQEITQDAEKMGVRPVA